MCFKCSGSAHEFQGNSAIKKNSVIFKFVNFFSFFLLGIYFRGSSVIHFCLCRLS